VRDGIATFVVADGCVDEPEIVEDGTVATESWPVCEAGTAVELVTIADGGHAWPGGRRISPALDEPSPDFEATPAIWDFFEAHPKQN